MTSSSSDGEWRLATDSGLPVLPPIEAEQLRNRSFERLEQPLHILTAEHCGWLLLIGYAVFTRLALLGARPLDASEATRALATIGGYGGGANVAPEPGWVNVLTAALATIGGTSDWSARIVPAFCGILVIAVAFGLRRYIGRAGGLALALLLTLSPGFTYYARADAPQMPSALIALTTLYAFCALKERPSTTRAAWLGIAIGFLAATPPDGRITTLSFVLALSVIGLYCLIARPHAVLNIRVWFKQYGRQLLIALVAIVAAWLGSDLFVDARRAASSGSPTIRAAGGNMSLIGALRCYLPALILDEILIVAAASVGLAAVFGARVRSMLAVWTVLWTLFSLMLMLTLLPPDIAYLPLVLLPLALLGAFGVEWLHHGNAWPAARIGIGALAVLTVYVQILTNFIYYAPDASEAAWNRHANLYWSSLTTTIQTRVYCRRAMVGIAPKDATAYFQTDAPALRWYLRELRPVRDPAIAAVTVNAPTANDVSDVSKEAADLRHFDFDYAMSWPLNWSSLTPGSALLYVFTGRAWADPIAAPVKITAPPLPGPTAVDLDE